MTEQMTNEEIGSFTDQLIARGIEIVATLTPEDKAEILGIIGIGERLIAASDLTVTPEYYFDAYMHRMLDSWGAPISFLSEFSKEKVTELTYFHLIEHVGMRVARAEKDMGVTYPPERYKDALFKAAKQYQSEELGGPDSLPPRN